MKISDEITLGLYTMEKLKMSMELILCIHI